MSLQLLVSLSPVGWVGVRVPVRVRVRVGVRVRVPVRVGVRVRPLVRKQATSKNGI